MEIVRPETWEEALEAKAAHPDALPIQGGTDVMVELNFDRARPERLLDLGGIARLREHERDGDAIVLGAAVTYTRLIAERRAELPGLAIAARTVGSPQIRNRGTVGGNLGAASPAGDSHPSLLAGGAEVVVESTAGARRIPIDDYYLGPKRSALRPDELIAAVRVPVARGPQQFSKIGPRNAMVIAATSCALSIDREGRRVGVGIGSAGPTPLRAEAAEAFLTGVLDEQDAWDGGARVDDAVLGRFGELVADAASPIDDVRATRAYRLHALAVLARRAATWTCAGGGARRCD